MTEKLLGGDRFPVAGGKPLALTVEQAAGELQVSAETVRRMLVRGELVGRLIGNRWRLSRRDLEEWLSRGERPPAAVVQMRRQA